jgi:hypothetical protein
MAKKKKLPLLEENKSLVPEKKKLPIPKKILLNECPFGHEFGKDADKFNECGLCHEWNDCYLETYSRNLISLDELEGEDEDDEEEDYEDEDYEDDEEEKGEKKGEEDLWSFRIEKKLGELMDSSVFLSNKINTLASLIEKNFDRMAKRTKAIEESLVKISKSEKKNAS